MTREDKLIMLYVFTCFFASCFYVSTEESRMALAGYVPFRLVGSTTVYWHQVDAPSPVASGPKTY